MRPVSDWMHFGNSTIWPSGEEVVAVSGSGRSLGYSPWNRLLEKADENGWGGVGWMSGRWDVTLSFFLYSVVWLCNDQKYDRGMENKGNI